jgi:hypothetical protein
MSLPSSITLTGGDPEVDLVFTDVSQLSGSSLVYYAPSPQGDLDGRPTLKISHETTGSGVKRSALILETPVLNPVTLKYGEFKKTTLTTNRKGTTPVAEVVAELEMMAVAITTLKQQIAAGLI